MLFQSLGLRFGFQFGLAVDGYRVGNIGFDVRRILLPVEDSVGGDQYDGEAQLLGGRDHVGGRAYVDLISLLGVSLTYVGIGNGRGMDQDVEFKRGQHPH